MGNALVPVVVVVFVWPEKHTVAAFVSFAVVSAG
jgi:hypothetical protein